MQTIEIGKQALLNQNTKTLLEQKEQTGNTTVSNEKKPDSKNHKQRGSWNLWRIAAGGFVLLLGVLIIVYLKSFHYQCFKFNCYYLKLKYPDKVL